MVYVSEGGNKYLFSVQNSIFKIVIKNAYFQSITLSLYIYSLLQSIDNNNYIICIWRIT